MRTRRLKAPPDAQSGFYHCISRVVDRRLVFGDAEKERFCDLMRRYARFCGVHILTFCVMGNHFHLLVEVPKRPDHPPDDTELLDRIAAIHSAAQTRAIQERLATAHPFEQEALRLRFWRRMGDISQFLKELKQRFSQWHNLRQGRHGTLWEERFKSVLVGADGSALSTIAAYIDLNPVRAGLVANPSAYRWSGYGQAMAGLSPALEGYRLLMAVHQGEFLGPLQALGRYRSGLFDYAERRGVLRSATPRPAAPGPEDGAHRATRKNDGFTAPLAHPVRSTRHAGPLRTSRPESRPIPRPADLGAPSLVELLLNRIRRFSEGAVIGSRTFVESIALHHRDRLHGKRHTSAHPFANPGLATLFSLRRSRA